MFTVITPTGDRPFDLCVKWMERQTRYPDQWLIVDDGKTPMVDWIKELPNVTYVRREPTPQDFPHTLVNNMQEALKHVEYDRVIMFEDDDYYRPEYLETMNFWLGFADLVGQIPAHYYQLALHKYKVFNNLQHASLCQTGFQLSKVKQILVQVLSSTKVSRSHSLDTRLWMAFKGKKYLGVGKTLCLGLKGLDGRKSTTHWQNLDAWAGDSAQSDSKMKFLTSVMGSDIKFYDKTLHSN